MMWTDPYIREHIVYAHLEPDDDDGTKPYAQVLAETAFWVKRFGAQGKVLDLGCGPGIYLRELAQKGWQGYGIDLNESAVSYAQDLNRDECLSFDIRSGDFLAEAWPPGMDLVIMVYGTFGTIPPKSRQHLVQKLKTPSNLADASSWTYLIRSMSIPRGKLGPGSPRRRRVSGPRNPIWSCPGSGIIPT
jgi:SAM-dependent methyltransferase